MTTPKDFSVSNYRCRVGVMFFGGAGVNNQRLVMNDLNPEEYPDFLLFGANTDAKVLKHHFGNKYEDQQKKWGDSLVVHQLGGDEVTKGRGAGGDPKVGRQAAQSECSKKAMTDFINNVDQVILAGGLGGGTGTGALPVAAQLAKDLGKTVLAIVIMPDEDDGRSERATGALREIQAIVPTISIQNSYLDEWMAKNMDEAQRATFTYKGAWEIVNRNSMVPMIRIIREIIQEVGEIINIDEADWNSILSKGNHVLFGMVDVQNVNAPHEDKAERLVAELFSAPFQNPRIIENGEVIALWAHGPWPKVLLDNVRTLVKNRVLNGRKQEIEVHKGNVHDVKDKRMWIALLVVAKDLAEALKLEAKEAISVAQPRQLRRTPVPHSSRIPLTPLPEAPASHAAAGSNGDSPEVELPTFIRDKGVTS